MSGKFDEFRFGCELEQDDDGDWILIPPEDVTIFSIPGEGYLIGRCDRKTAAADAHRYLAALYTPHTPTGE